MDEQISQFVSITGASSEKAKFYVESARGDVEEAVSTYFEAEGAEGEGGNDVEDDETGQAAVPASSGPRTLSGAPAPPMPEGWGSGGGGGSGGAASGRMTSLADLGTGGRGGRDDDDDDDRDEDDERGPANFFTGGERSGLSVQNPNHGRRGGGDAPEVVNDILQRAREMAERRARGGGAPDDDDDDDDWGEGGPAPMAAGRATKPKSTFAGQGRTLGDSVDDAAGAASNSGASSSAGGSVLPGSFQLAGQGAGGDAAEADQVVDRRIIFWTDGFSLEDGPLCRYDDPQHAATLAMINGGSAPLSFLNVRFGQKVNLTVEQRKEKYKEPPPPPMKPFGGEGNRLGSPAPTLASSSSASAAPATAAPATPSGPIEFNLDSTQPTTQLQVRLADGQRMAGRFNHTHTVADVRSFINAAHPEMSSRAYVLQASFPPKPFTDETQSLKDAGLLNAVVIQKWT